MRWVRLGLVAAFLLSAAAAGAAGVLSRSDETPPVSAAPDLSATAEIRRSFNEPGTVAIAVTNHGAEPVQVTGIELFSDSFAGAGVQEFDTRVPPSVNPRDLIIEYGRVRCPDGIDSIAAASHVVLNATTEDGAGHVVEAALPHPNGTLDRLVREACGAELIEASVALELGDLVRAGDGTLTGDLTVLPLGPEQVEVTALRGSVLFEASSQDLSGESVPLRLDAARCTGHAVGDAKQPFAFHAWISVDGSEPVPTPIPVEARHEQALYAMLDERCGHSGD